MSTLHTAPVSLDAREHEGRSFPLALVALVVTLVAVTGICIYTWQSSSGGHVPSLTRVVGPGTFVRSVYDEQVPAAAAPLTDGSVFREQVPAEARGNTANGVKGLDDDSARLSRGGNKANGVQGLDDDSAALTAGGG